MTYQEVLDYLFNQFPQYQKIGNEAYKPGLDNIKALCEHLGEPQQKLKFVHVAGTNGKGSTCSMLASILKEAGYRVGLFTSPHLVDFSERIRINGQPIDQTSVIDFVNKHKAFFDQCGASFFEWSTALAFDYFHQQAVDIVVLETGLGGRLDSTNIVDPILTIITNIGIDHTQYLGDTLTSIAREKAGIIKNNVPIITSVTNEPEVIEVIQEAAKDRHAKLILAKKDHEYQSDLEGEFQQINRGMVLAAINELNNSGFDIHRENISRGFKMTVRNSGLRGRWEVLQLFPRIIADIGHNYDGVEQMVKQLKKEKYNQLRIVWGMVSDKEIERIVKILPKKAQYYLSAPNIKRAMEVEKLASFFSYDHKVKNFNKISEAFSNALTDSQSDDLILVAGSNFVVAEIISEFFD
ncbi:MAG: bifunctional folylpolyglutamate synthase/dihydrofolate synthase [Flavobacteriales bacterium]|nr:bifunctional folylpolyglutamate synthase/dihydrofolate synthase [Flavobacteriales bacterium]